MRRVSPLLLVVAGCAPGLGLAPSPDPHGVVVTLPEPGRVTCTSADDSRSLDLEATGTLRGLLADSTYSCRAELDGGGHTTSEEWSTEPLPDDFPEAEIRTADADAGSHLLDLAGDGGDSYLAILDAQGRPRWHLGGANGRVGVDATLVGDRITYCGDETAEIDLDGEVRWEPSWTPASAYETPVSWHHDAAPTEDGTGLLTLTEEILGYDERAPILGFVVRRVARTEGAEEWAWSVGEDGAETFPVEDDDTWHANAVSEVEGGYLVGLRETEEVVKLDAETRSVAWSVGDGRDFTLLEADGTPAADTRWFGPHHDAKLEDGQLFLFDNGEVGRGSRAMVLALDEDARTARIVFEWQRGPEWYSGIWGGVDPLPDGAVSIAFGQPGDDGPPSALYHVDPDGTVTWELVLPPRIGVYRSQWLGEW